MEQGEIAIQVRHEHQESASRELHAIDTQKLKLQGVLPDKHKTMQQHLMPKKNTNMEIYRNPLFSLLTNYKNRSAQKWKPSAAGSYKLRN